MRAIVDTNVLVRAITEDDARQGRVAQTELTKAEAVIVTLPALCELVWVLMRGYAFDRADVAEAVRRLAGAGKVVVDRGAVEAGLALLEAGGDFADGVIVHEGARLGGDVLMSFDKRAARMAEAQGARVRRLS